MKNKNIVSRSLNVKKNIKSIRKDNFTYNETTSLRFKGNKLIYNNLSKRIIKENPNLLRSVLLLSNTFKKKITDPNKRFVIEKITNKIINKKKQSAGYISNAFTLKVKVDGSVLKFFIKETLQKKGLNISLTEEMMGLKIIEKDAKRFGFNIIKPHLAFDGYKDSKKSFIVYNFSKLLTVREAFDLKKISEKQTREISDRLLKFERFLKDKGLKEPDVNDRNCFVDFSEKPFKLYLFDVNTLEWNHSLLKSNFT